MPLNEMSLKALQDLNSTLCAIEEAMGVLETHGVVTLASLEPGRQMAIRLVTEMPVIGYQPDPAPMVWDRVGDAAPPPFEKVSIREAFRDAPVADLNPDKYARAAGLIDNEGFAVEQPEQLWQVAGLPADPGSTIELSATITAEAPPAGDTGERVVPAPEPAVTGPGEAAAPPAAPGPTPWPVWTEEDVDRLIEAVAVGMEFDGLSLRAASLRAAPGLGRPGEGTCYKARSLIERIEARRRVVGERLRTRAPEAVAAPAPDPEDVPEPQPAVLPGDPDDGPGPGALTPFGEMVAYLQTLPRKRGWTLQRDHDVLHYAILNWKPNEIALHLGIPGDELKPRFAMLTRTGQYKRAEVLAALTEMLAAEGKAA